MRKSNDPVTKALVENYRIWLFERNDEPIGTDESKSSNVLGDLVSMRVII
jgi:hypothetical protein